ncbi:conserved domain protein [Bacteroides xylanisolvens SD CC 2a]|nr:conserved domain protein [Bacteroides xylanisolvens SD CC 2a]
MDLTRGVMQGGTRLITGRVRAVKVTLKAGYKVLLVTKRQ